MTPANLGLSVGLHHDIAAEAYHADQLCAEPTLSRSLAETLIFQSPLHALHKHPRIAPAAETGEPESEDDATPAMDFGTLGHALLLGRGSKIAVGEYKDFKKTEAKDWRDNARAGGFTPVLRKTYNKGLALRNAALANITALGLLPMFEAAKPEVVAIFKEGEATCRVMFDKLLIEQRTIIDLKITGSAHPSSCKRQIGNMHYDLQEGFYRSALQRLDPNQAGRERFIFLFIEDTFPFCVTPIELDAEWKSIGIIKYNHAVQVWRECRRRNEWPPYVSKLTKVSPKEWAVLAAAGLESPEFKSP